MYTEEYPPLVVATVLTNSPWPAFMKWLSQGLGLNKILLYWTFKPKPWLSPFVTTDPVV